MSSPVYGNFGHVRESGVLLLTKEDSEVKHKRNIILATASIGSVFLVGIPALVRETEKERRIRDIGRQYPNLPYSACVNLEKYGSIVFKGTTYETQTRQQARAVMNDSEDSNRSYCEK